jgi:hypothetical protein
MFEIAQDTRQRDAFRAAHQERGKMLRDFFRAFRR